MFGARALLVCLALTMATRSLAAPAPPASGELVVLADPQPPARLPSASGTEGLTLAYRVVEVFAGEPESASLVVRHPSLEPAERSRLAAGERVILVVRRDDSEPGRWIGSAPLRATDEAIEAFRGWGAPSDVRDPRPLAEVVTQAGGVGVVLPPRAEPAPEPKPDVTRPDVQTTPAPVEPARRPRPAAVPASEPPSEPAASRAREVPRSGVQEQGVDAVTAPATHAVGLGLPPEPPRSPLGPPLSQRRDLRTPTPRRQ